MMPMERPLDIVAGLVRRSKSFGPCSSTHNHGDACRTTGLRLRTVVVNGSSSVILEGLLENQGWALTMTGIQWTWRAIMAFPGTRESLEPKNEEPLGTWFCHDCRKYWPSGANHVCTTEGRDYCA